MDNFLTVGKYAVRLGVLEQNLRRMCDRQEVPFTMWQGMRLLDLRDEQAIREACIKRGFLRAEPSPATA